MRTDFDFAPYYRATVGFDRVFDMLDSMAGQPSSGGYPPYNIEKTGDDAWRIVMAVAGFTEAELNITQKEDELLVTGKGQPNRHDRTEFLYRGIGGRDFERRFQLADHVRVTRAQAGERPALHRAAARVARGEEAAADPHRGRGGAAHHHPAIACSPETGRLGRSLLRRNSNRR